MIFRGVFMGAVFFGVWFFGIGDGIREGIPEGIRVQTSATIVTTAVIINAIPTGKNKNPTSEARAANAIFPVRLSQEQSGSFGVVGKEVDEEEEDTRCMISSLV
jgi:hypothetical protein